MMRVRDVVRLLRVARSTVWDAIAAGEFPGLVRIRGHIRIPQADVAAWVHRESTKPRTRADRLGTQKRRAR
jgi:excisionase family DNA binding protein